MGPTDREDPLSTTSRPPCPTRRTRARRGEGERLREEILAAAERLLIDRGDAAAVGIRDVAKAVGVTPPSIYLHFADKTDLLFAVCEVHWERFDRIVREAVEGVVDPAERLRACGRAYVRFGLRNPEHYRILFMSRHQELPDRVDMAQLLEDSGFSHVVTEVTRAIEAGVIEGEAMTLVFELWAAVHGLTSLMIAHPDMPWPDRDVLVEHLLDMTLRGLAPSASGPRSC